MKICRLKNIIYLLEMTLIDNTNVRFRSLNRNAGNLDKNIFSDIIYDMYSLVIS
jgi:hypothetical protein